MTSIGILPESLQTSLLDIVERVNECGGGIRVILLSTGEGVPLGRIPSPLNDLSEATLSSLESTWAPAPKQLSLLKMSKIRTVTACYETATVIHLYVSPIVVTLVLFPNENLGVIQSTAIPLLKQTLEPLCTTLLHSLAAPNNGEQASWQQDSGTSSILHPDDGFYQ